MTTSETGRRRIYPPVYFFGSILAMLGLHWLVPGPRCPSAVLRLVGVLCIIAGVGLVLWAVSFLRRSGTTIKPFEESTALIVAGPYRLTRNPMYLGMSSILLGIAGVLGSLWPLVVIPIFMTLIQRRFIRIEEAGLEAKFGETYATYKTRVRRWL